MTVFLFARINYPANICRCPSYHNFFDVKMSAYYVEDAEYAKEGECKDLMRRINEEKNRFSYPWQDEKDDWHNFRFIEYNDADVSDYRAEASQKWQKAKVENLMKKISRLELEKDDPSLCEKMKNACEKEKMPWVCEANDTYQKECSSNSRRENIKKRGGGGGTRGEAPPPLSFRRR